MKPDIDRAVQHAIDGLYTDGAHHKQWELEQILVALKGQDWVDEYKNNIEKLDPEEYYIWDEGIPG